MNKELTNEVLEAMAKCSKTSCSECPAVDVCYSKGTIPVVECLATALLEERAKPKAWDGAPDDATQAQIEWYDENDDFTGEIKYTRELPKTRARQIAENIVHGINGKTRGGTKDIEYVEGVLKRYAEELEGKE